MKKRYYIAIAILLLFCSVLFVLTHFSKATILSTEGYFVTGTQVEEVLLAETKVAKSKNIQLEKVTYEDNFYNNLGNLYIGEEKKIEVNSNYPIYSNEGLAIVNINEKSKLINSNFEFFDSYENFTLTGGKLYNYGDLEQADYENYIFLQLPNGIYVNLYNLEITTLTKSINVPLNSIIYFDGNYLRYFSYSNDGKMVYHIEEGIDLYNEVKMGDVTFTYKDLLQAIGKVEKDETSTSEENTTSENEETEEGTGSGSSTGEGSSGSVKYVKPEVSADNFVANVYSASSKLTIYDPAGVIVGGVNFEFKMGDKTFLRKTFVSSGSLTVIGLVPNTEFTIIGSYKYYNENNKKMEYTFFEQKIKTGDTKNLSEIKLGFDNGEIYSNKIELNNLRILSSLDNEAINGISKGVIYINGEMYSIPKSLINEMINGNSGTYTSPAKLPSDTTINYEIKFLDAFDNEIKLTNNKGKTRTSKKEPTVSLTQSANTVTSTYFNVKLKNTDDVNINSYRYVIYDNKNAVVLSHNLDSSEEEQSIELSNLDPNTTYVIKVLGDYDIEDGKGINKDAVLGESKFTTKPLSSLGYVRVKSGTVEVTSDSATLESYIDTSAVAEQLLDLLNSFKMIITDEEDNVIYERVYDESNIQEIIGGEKFSDVLLDLYSGTEYFVTFKATAKQGNVEEEIPVTCTFKSFTINKTPAEVNIMNRFVTGDMIDFDVRIDDLEGTILSNRVILEIRDSSDKLISTEYLDINSDYVQLTYTKLVENTDYKFTYKVEEYNEGYDNRSYQSDYTIFEEYITTTPGIKGSVQLTSLLRQIESSNLFNIEDYARIRKEGNTGYKDYDIKNNVMTLGAKGGYVNYSYFVPEAANSTVKVSFYAKYAEDTPNKASVYLSKSYGDTRSYLLEGLSDEYQKYTFTFKTTSNYIGFDIIESSGTNTRTNIDIKELIIINTNSDDSETDITKSYHKSGYKFTDTIMSSGEESMPTHDGTSTMVGNSGNGYAKITNLLTNAVTVFNYTGSSQSFNATPGRYKIELWGAQGGNSVWGGSTYYAGGKGAYTSGVITITDSTTLYIYVGGQGEVGKVLQNAAGGYNGGGSGCHDNSDDESDGGGGGATDVRLVSGVWNNLESLQSRIMVAAGGGGGSDNIQGGAAGGITSKTVASSTGASQYSGYAFGYGQDGVLVRKNYPIGGGGGGYYGGYAIDNGSNYYNPGAGGSSYISGHTGCVAYHFSAQASSEYVAYKEKDTYMGTLSIDLVDLNNEIVTNDFYLRIYSGGQLVENKQFELGSEELVDYITNYEFAKNKNFSIYLSVKIRDRFYDISSVSFDSTAEIRSITNATQFANMHTNAKYIVLNDLDFRSRSGFTSTFYGEIDFQGYTIYTNVQGRSSYILYSLGSGGLVENLVLDYTIDNTSARTYYYGFAQYNYGTVDNLMININEGATQCDNYVFTMGFYVNYGKIRNFVINSMGAVSARSASGILVWSNEGVIENGYVYGQNMNGNFESYDRDNKDMAPIAGQMTTNGVIRNVFSLISVNKDTNPELTTEVAVGNLVGYSATGRVENSYSVEDPDVENSKFTSQDPNFGRISSATVKNLYYVSNVTYLGNKSSMMSKLALWDESLQNKLLNSNSGFDVSNYVPLGYYPQVKMNDCMPRQELIALPKVTDSDLVDVTSSEQVEVGGDYATVKIYLNNPAGETISDVGIRDIGSVEILSQENMYGKTTLLVKISSPSSYKSKYYIRSLSVTGVMGYEYQKTYTDYERPIDVDLYYPIKTLSDWKTLVSNPNQNYILMNDLDFKGETIKPYIVSSTFKGKLNGNGKTLKNITISSTDYHAFFNCYVQGTIENLYVENYKKTGSTSFGGFVYRASSNAMFDNVHISDAEIVAYNYLGGLVSYSDNTTTIKNCSVTNLVGRTDDTRNIIGFRAGGLVGYIATGTIMNSYVYNLDFEFNNLLTSSGIGGLAGQTSNGYIEDVYATGNIKANSNYVGGIAGNGSAKVSRAWTGVNISTELDYVGGIYGYRDTTSNVNTLVTGDIYSSYDGLNINRTFGNSVSTQMGYFAWNGQKVYGMVTTESQIEELLTLEELSDADTYIERIGLGDQFDYTDLTDGKMPKLKNIDTGELLPNQNDYKLILETINVDEITINAQVDKADLNIVFDNPNEYEITELLFDYLTVSSVRGSSTKNGKTTFMLTVTPEYYYDSYSLTGVKYINDDGIEKTASLYTRIEKTFYRQITDIDDWLEIGERDTAENYLLTTDLDFSPEANNGRVITAPSGLKIARLESNSATENRTIKNININLTSGGNGMIKVLTKTLTGINFENITISMEKTNSSGYYSGDYVGVIGFNYADINNIELKNIVVDAPSSSYVGFIAANYAQDIRYVKMNGEVTQDTDGNDVWSYKVKGVSYVGGFIGYSADRDTYHLEADSIYVYGTGTYVGGAVGHKPYNYTCNDYYYRLNNMYVTGKSNVGGMFGYGVANGNKNSDGTINYSYVTNSKIHNIGGDYTGAVAGTARHYYSEYIIADNNEVTSVGTYAVGGIFGWSYDVRYCYVYNTTVTNGNGTYTGGFTGVCGYSTYYSGVENTVVTTTGTGAGGMFGYKDGNAYYNYTKDVTVIGKDRVGGIVGYATRARIYRNSVNANIIATGNNTGGLIGYLNDIDPETTTYSTTAYENILVNSNISSTGDRVGLFAGYIPQALINSYHYNNVLVANMTVTDTAKYGILTGYDNEYITEVMPRFFIYENNKIIVKSDDEIVSSEYVKDITDFASITYADSDTKSRMLPSATSLRTASYWTGTAGFTSSYWSTSWTNSDGTTSSVSDGYYPRNKQSISWNPVFELPVSDVTYQLRTFALGIKHELPEVEVYSSGVNTLNIEFSDVDDYTYFEVYEDNKKIFDQDLVKKTYSISYNYKSDLKIVVMDGVNTRNYTFKAEDLVNKVTTFDNNYAYIYDDGELIGNVDVTDNKFIHLYNNRALTADLKVYDLAKETIISSNNTFGVSLLTDAIALYTFEYDGILIDTYATYSVIHKEAGDVIFESQIFVKDGVLEIVDGELDNVKNSIIVDEYAKDNYVTILGTDGIIYNLKEAIKTPSNFTNKNIKYMSNNINSKSSIVVVMYDTGKVVVFDYRTGKKVEEKKATEDISVVDYFKESFSTVNSILDSSELLDSYDEALEVKKNLEKNPILTTMTGEYITESTNKENSDKGNNVAVQEFDKNYVTYYNATKGSYDVINVEEVIKSNNSNVVSENDKIYTSNDFVDLYMQKSVLEKIFGNVNAVIIFVIILVGIFGALGLWFRSIRKLKES